MNHYPAWKNLLIAAVVALGILIALPNLFGKAPSVQVSRDDSAALDDAAVSQIQSLLDSASVSNTESYLEEGKLFLRFDDVQEQLRTSQLLVRPSVRPGPS